GLSGGGLRAAGGSIALPLILGDANAGRAEQAVFQDITDLYNLNNGAGRFAAAGAFEHDFVEIGVEKLTQWVDLANAVLFEVAQHLAFRCFDALNEILDASLGFYVIRNCIEGAAQIVGDVQHIPGEGGNTIAG